ncbi:MAG: FKBP-type peptidyl-prolyl cis-trans isomerase [Opitutales bacterium]|jgi:FKBP-type peptidyl-prolyl cis-trans isomerase SlyD
MQVTNDHVVSMHYTLTSPNGEVIDSSKGKEPLAYLHGHGNIIPGLEKQLEGKVVGDKLVAEVPAGEAYGEHNPELIVKAQRSQFPEGVDLQAGMQFQAQTPQGPRVAKITEVEGDTISVDTNHPLAGVDLKFDVEITDIRAAKPEELSHGHVHAGGCGCSGGDGGHGGDDHECCGGH